MSGKWDHVENMAVRLVGAVVSIAIGIGIVMFVVAVKQPTDMLIPAMLFLWWLWFLRMAWLGTKAKRHAVLNERNLVVISAVFFMWFAKSARVDYERRMHERVDSVADSVPQQ